MRIFPGSTHEFNIPSRNVLENMINALLTKMPDDRIVSSLVKHLTKLDKSKMNTFSDITIILRNLGNVRLHFRTTRVEVVSLEYTIHAWNNEPPDDLKHKTFIEKVRRYMNWSSPPLKENS